MAELLLENNNHIAQIIINRPESRNALSRSLLLSLSRYIHDLSHDSLLRVLIIRGMGDKAFCAGADLKERQTMDEDETRAYLKLIQGTFQKLAEFPMPVIAAINGDAFGGGLELALACDIRIAADHARMGLTECSLGIIPGAGGTQRLPLIVGMAKACELIFASLRLSSEEALAIGLLNQRVAPSEDLLSYTLKFAQTIAQNAPLALRAAKKALWSSHHEYLKKGLDAEFEAYGQVLLTKDRIIGLRAFLEKQKAEFIGA